MLVEAIPIIPGIRAIQVPVARILQLRQRVLEVGELPGDLDKTTWHFAAFQESSGRLIGEPVSCVSYMLDELMEEPAWRLNALATDPQHRGHRIALRMLAQTQSLVIEEHPTIRLFWCYAREAAFTTYTKDGWKFVSDIMLRRNRRYRQMTKRHV